MDDLSASTPEHASARHARWTKSDIEEFLAREKLQYQRIELPHGLSTPGTARVELCDAALADVRGKTVLDVGSYLGYFCLEALARGARAATGWDVDADRVRQARIIAEIRQAPAEYVIRDFERVPVTEAFDVVLCLNVLHHLIDPIAALDKLVAMTRETLVLEVATLGDHDRAKFGWSKRESQRLAQYPVIVVGSGGSSGDRAQKFFFTKEAIRNLLTRQRQSFARVEFLDTGFKGRFAVIAHRRRVRHLVVVAGPTSAGKSTFISRLQSNAFGDLNDRLGVADFSAWPTVSARRLPRLTEPRLDGLIFHYDFLRPLGRSSRVPGRDEALQLLDCADKVSLITIWTPHERLRQQFETGELEAWRAADAVRRRSLRPADLVRRLLSRPARTRLKLRHLEILKMYSDPARVLQLYALWGEFCRTWEDKGADHVVVQLTNDALTVLTTTGLDPVLKVAAADVTTDTHDQSVG